MRVYILLVYLRYFYRAFICIKTVAIIQYSSQDMNAYKAALKITLQQVLSNILFSYYKKIELLTFVHFAYLMKEKVFFYLCVQIL